MKIMNSYVVLKKTTELPPCNQRKYSNRQSTFHMFPAPRAYIILGWDVLFSFRRVES